MTPPLTPILGTGNPNGVVTADPGARYIDLNGTATTSVSYVKRSGVGTNTGWVGDMDAGTVTYGMLASLARTADEGWKVAGSIASTTHRKHVTSSTLVLTSGTMRMVGGLVLPGGLPVSSVLFVSGGTAGAGLTHSFVAFFDRATLALLATTEDVTTASWPAQTTRTWNIATALRGATPGGTFTPASDQEVYLGITCIGTTMPSFLGENTVSTLNGLTSHLHGDANAGLTGLADIPSTASTPGTLSGLPYAYVS